MAADAYDPQRDRFNVGMWPNMPARRAIAVTKSDTLDVTDQAGDAAPCYAMGLYIGVSGDVAVITAGDQTGTGNVGTTVTFKAVPVGILNVQVRRVMSTNTTATNMVGLYQI